MKFELPVASRQRLDELLEYLGDRAEDFKKCFDIESEWCWKYASIVLQGIGQRHLSYAERHHIVPRSYYYGKNVDVDLCNTVSLSYVEHVYAHLYAAECALGKMRGKMAIAFNTMISIAGKGAHKVSIHEQELFNLIDQKTIDRIRAMNPRVSKVECEGRTHWWEDPDQAMRESRKIWNANHPEECRKMRRDGMRRWAESHPDEYKQKLDKLNEWDKTHPEQVKASAKKYRDSHPDKIKETQKRYAPIANQKARERRAQSPDKYREQERARYASNPEKYREQSRIWNAKKPEKRKQINARWAKNNPPKVSAARKANRDSKIAAGFRNRKDPITGKRHWIFVGVGATRPRKYSTDAEAAEAKRQKSHDSYREMTSKGYRKRKDPVDGKVKWMLIEPIID